MSGQELLMVREVFDLQRLYGDRTYAGFAAAVVPLVLYNDRYEFRSGYAGSFASQAARLGWEQVETVRGQYFRRPADAPESFARKIDGQWVGSIMALDPVNRDMLLNAREQLPEPIASLLPYSWMTIEPDQHVVLSLHEMFHAYQAQENEARFLRAIDLFVQENVYPYRREGFEASWNQEGELLHLAMQAQNESDLASCIRAFLEHRRERRSEFDLVDELVSFECEMEWLEGLGKYVEMRMHELAAMDRRMLGEERYPLDLPHWWDELRCLHSALGKRDGQFRFYLSGMAQARILDKALPGWQERALAEARLEDLLAEAIDR
ncbi:MAG: hypothetical protein ACYTG5_12825 [Planctomycetota bacterium]|jgi:hypothetical protein